MSGRSGRILLWAAILLACLLGGQVFSEFYITLLNYIGLYALVALGLVLLTGVSGITSFGQAAFVGIGAYTTAVLTVNFGLSPWVGLGAGLVVNLLAALVLGGITLRLSGHYLPLGTICWSMSLYYVFGNMAELGGQTGMTGIPAISVFGTVLDSGRSMFYLIWFVVLVALLLTQNLLDSRPGRAMRALKKDAEMAENFGVNGSRVKLAVFVYAALLASISGWLYAHLLRFVNPAPFGITMSIEYLFMAVVGGAGYVWGAVLGSAVIVILRESLQDVLPAILGRSGNFEIIAFGALIILLLQLNRDKGFGVLLERLPRFRKPAAAEDASLEPIVRPAMTSGTLLAVKGVGKRFGGLVAVNDVSFEVGPGQIVAVIGPNGAGKSTLFNVLTRCLATDGGEVWLRGERVDQLPAHELVHRGLSRSYQHVRLVPDRSVLENVMFGAHGRSRRGPLAAAFGIRQAVEDALRKEAERQIGRVGLAAMIDEPAGNLALGQQRLVEIARALCAAPDLLLLDEPAAGLRHNEKNDLASLLKQLRAGGMSILLVEHDMRFVMEIADDVVVLNFGNKLAQGAPQQIRRDPKVLEAYLGVSAP
ncbi:branched-chain amino acid transport system permease protein [Rhodoligotrophos appendicifer]|uniref:branched-chain amino acid ABC transporter ATP-binding protein/permease n=1 Tax=Rhodoligotrophos appendicifer TaxID=987056 RepID=UPI001184D84F|nr:branched-chain amino acid ABC transporter ATP-binding protein/permease [Rhodoligotrophos appendicifer]